MPPYLQDQVYRCHAWPASSRWDETRALTIGNGGAAEGAVRCHSTTATRHPSPSTATSTTHPLAARPRAQDELDLGLDVVVASGELEIVSSRMEHVWDALCRACGTLGLTVATGGDEVFRDRVLAWIIEPASKLDSLRVLAEAGIGPACHATLKRRLPVHAEPSWRQRLAAACAGTRRSDRPLWSCATCPRSISKPMPVTGSASRGSPRNAAPIVTALVSSLRDDASQAWQRYIWSCR